MSLWKLPATVPQQLVLQAECLAKRIIDAVYEGYVRLLCSRLIDVCSLVMPHVKQMCKLLPLVMLFFYKHALWGLHIWVSLKGTAI